MWVPCYLSLLYNSFSIGWKIGMFASVPQTYVRCFDMPPVARILSIPPSDFFEENEPCLKFSTITTVSTCTKHISLPYHFFWFKVEAIQIEDLFINTNYQLA